MSLSLLRLVRTIPLLVLALWFAAPAPLRAQHEHHAAPADTVPATAAALHAGHAMMRFGPLGIPQSREGSGTSWLPDASPMYAVHRQAGSWELMLHGNAFLQYIDEGSERGSSQLGSVNWVMGMARREFAGGELGARAMLSLEPLTVGKCGFPVLLQSGEECNGAPIHDRQHPHDLFMELAVDYQRAIAPGLGIQLYGGPVAEPALGPTAFPHRPSALPSPSAPISHHWLDATHIAFGSATAGVFGRQWKAEASLFNGREPDDNRYDFDFAPLDSYSGRVSFLPNDRWALQVSGGHLSEAEPGEHAGDAAVDVNRYTASAVYDRPLGQRGNWATTLAVGRNVHEGEGTDAALLETSYDAHGTNLFFGRAEWAQKTGHDLALETEALNERVFGVGQLMAGYVRQFRPVRGWRPGVGGRVSVNLIPDGLKSFYGRSNPPGIAVFVSLRPAPMEMGAMPGMEHDALPGMTHP